MSILVSSLANTAAILQAAAEDGITLADVQESIPTDPASVFTILLLVASLGLVLWFGRPKSGKGGKAA